MAPVNPRGWIVLGLGFVVTLAPLVWEPLVVTHPAEWGVGPALIHAWGVLPFFVLAVLDQGLKMSTPSFLVAAAVITGATLALQIGVLLYSSGSTDAVAFLFLPVWLSVAVGVVAGLDKAVRASVARVRRGGEA